MAVLDSKGPTFRHKLDPSYKANRPETPDALKKQIGAAAELIPKLGIPVLQRDGFEADDFIAAAARRARECGWNVEIYSGDKDLTQLVDDHIKMLGQDKKTGGFALTDAAAVEEKWGVPPARIADLFAIIGDASDNVPGVKGIGPKGAAKLVASYGTLENIYAHLDKIEPKGIREKLTASRDMAFHSLKMVRLDADVGAIPPPEELALKAVDRDGTLAMLTHWEMASTIKRFGLDRTTGPFTLLDFPEGSGKKKPTAKAVLREVEPEEPKVPKAPKELKAYVRKTLAANELEVVAEMARSCGEMVLDLETTSLDPYSAVLVGAVFAFPGEKSFYVRLCTHERNDGREFITQLKGVFEDPAIKKIGHNLKFERSILKSQGIGLDGLHWDTMLGAMILDANRPTYNLESLLLDLFGVEKKTFKQLLGKTPSILDLPEADLEAYTFDDGEFTYRLFEYQKAHLGPGDLKVFMEQEMPLIPVLSDMEREGVEVDKKELERQSAAMAKELESLEKKIHELAGGPFNVQSTKQLQEVLFVKLGLHTVRKTKTGFSTDAEVLEILARDHEIAKHLLRHRLLSKLKGTYLDSLPDLIHKHTGRIHTDYNQTGAATGRLSSTNPNLQNIPIQGPEGKAIRRAFVAPAGFEVVSFDYSQVELRILAILSKDPRLLLAYQQGRDIHRETAAFLFEKKGESVTDDERRIAKVINFSVIYGASAFGLSGQLGLPQKETQKFIDGYFAAYRGVRAYQESVLEAARRDRWVSTYFGRRREMRDIHASSAHVRQHAERTAFNTVIQGTAADLIKQAMIRVYRRTRDGEVPIKLVMQVHDELVFYMPEGESSRWAPAIITDMKTLPPFDTILEVGTSVGKSWEK